MTPEKTQRVTEAATAHAQAREAFKAAGMLSLPGDQEGIVAAQVAYSLLEAECVETARALSEAINS